MKKILLLSATALVAFSAMGQLKQPMRVFKPLSQASNNGKYVAFSSEGSVGTYDLTTADGDFKFYGDETGVMQYAAGNGMSISDDGILVGTTTANDAAILDIKKGEWTQLPVTTQGTFGANAITADGSMIVGYVSASDADIMADDNITAVPALWVRNERTGSYTNPVVLPYPEKDFTGRVPIYVMAVTVSMDGNWIGGQIWNFLSMPMPIYWHKNAEGAWEYVDISESLLNPKGVVFPEWVPYPSDYPEAENFMTAAEIAAYNEAVAKYQAGELEEYPLYEDFMTDDELKSYEAAATKYNSDLAAAMAAQEPWWEAYSEAFDNSPDVDNNSLVFNGHEYATSGSMPDPNADPMDFFAQGTPVSCIYNLAEKKWRTVEGFKVTAQDGGNNILGFKYDQYMNYQGVALKNGSDTPITFNEWLAEVNPEYVEWMKENMSYDFTVTEEVEDPSAEGGFTTIETDVKDYLITGCPFAAQSFNLVGTWFENTSILVDGEEPWYFSCLLPLELDARIEGVGTDNSALLSMSTERGGIVRLAGEAKSLRVYDLQGRVVFEQANPSSEVSTGLSDGLFIVKAEGVHGGETVSKAIF